MKLYYYTLASNFGDQLNPWLWGRLISECLDDDDGELFIGIGTILNHRIPQAHKKIVFGSGVGYGQLPAIDSGWSIYFVRGPLSANKLGLEGTKALTDPALLVRKFMSRKENPKYKFTYMPHGQNASDAWRKICSSLNYGYIDAYKPVDQVLDEIADTEVLITEAMHGAIVADALRIPWIPVFTTKNMFEFKWIDWCKSVGLEFRKEDILPVWDESYAVGLFDNMRHRVKVELARKQLSKISRNVIPVLSDEKKSDSLLVSLEEEVLRFKNDCKDSVFLR